MKTPDDFFSKIIDSTGSIRDAAAEAASPKKGKATGKKDSPPISLV